LSSVLLGKINRLSDGRITYVSRNSDFGGISTLALQSIEVGDDKPEKEEDSTIIDQIIIEGFGQNVYRSSGSFDVFIGNDYSLYGLNIENNDIIRLLNWFDINIDVYNGGIESLIMLSDERIICNVRYPTSTKLFVLKKTPISELSDKIILTLATYNMQGEMRSLVANFNNENQAYAINVIDYRDYDISNGDYSGITRLNTEIITGKIPDIIDLTYLPYNLYAAGGLLEDLYPFIDNDPEYSRNDFIEGVFKAAEVNGKLYQLFPAFGIRTMAGNPSVLGEETGWNLDNIRAVLNANPNAAVPFGRGYPVTKTEFLRYMIEHNIGDLIDWSTGTANFQTDYFKDILEFVNANLPGEVDGFDWVGLGIADPSHTDFFTKGLQIYKPITQDDIDKLMDLFNSLRFTINYSILDEPFFNIIFESANDYFNGLITVDDAARIIQKV